MKKYLNTSQLKYKDFNQIFYEEYKKRSKKNIIFSRMMNLKRATKVFFSFLSNGNDQNNEIMEMDQNKREK